MKRIIPMALATAVSLAAGTYQAQAGIFLSMTWVSINSELEAQGWEGLIFSVGAIGPSHKITGVDLKNDVLGKGGTIGVFGQLHQAWAITRTNSTNRTATPSDTNANSLSVFQNDGTDVDSKFINSSYWSLSIPDQFTEDNNRTNGSNSSFVSPLADTAPSGSGVKTTTGIDYGVGSLMTFSGAALGSEALISVDVVFVIVRPWDGDVRFRGYVAADDGVYFVDLALSDIPEPTSLTTLALGGLALLSRRRRRH